MPNIYTMSKPELEAEYRRVWASRDPDECADSDHVRTWQASLDAIEDEMACLDDRGNSVREYMAFEALRG